MLQKMSIYEAFAPHDTDTQDIGMKNTIWKNLQGSTSEQGSSITTAAQKKLIEGLLRDNTSPLYRERDTRANHISRSKLVIDILYVKSSRTKNRDKINFLHAIINPEREMQTV